MTVTVLPKILVRIALSSTMTRDDARRALSGHWRGVLGVNGVHFSCRFAVPDRYVLAPGDVVNAGVQFLFPEAAQPHFPIGARFSVWEGLELGHGEVLDVLSTAPHESGCT